MIKKLNMRIATILLSIGIALTANAGALGCPSPQSGCGEWASWEIACVEWHGYASTFCQNIKPRQCGGGNGWTWFC